jgi:hypothetical protein
MAILGKGVATTSHTHIYTVPASKRAIVLLNATNTNINQVGATLSIREKVDYEVGGILVNTEGTTYTAKPDLVFSSGNATAVVTALNVKNFSFGGTETGYNIGDVLTASNATNRAQTDVNFSIIVTSIEEGTGKIVSYIFNDNGTYANAIPSGNSITFTGGTGVGATLTVASLRYGIKTTSVTNPGDDYTVTPTIATCTAGTTTPTGNGALTAQMVSDAIRKYDAIEYNTQIPAGSSIERSAIVLGAGDSIYAQCGTADSLNVVVFGVEEIA